VILRTRGADREIRAFAPQPIPRYPTGIGAGYTPSGQLVTTEKALGLPAVMAAIRLVAETIASLPLVVYQGKLADKRPADDSWQAKLLADPAANDFSSFDVISDIAASIEAAGNAYVQKIKGTIRRQVVALRVLNPQYVRVQRDKNTQEKLFLISDGAGRWQTVSKNEILHIRGYTVDGSDTGLSPIAVHRDKLGVALSLNEFESAFFRNGTRFPGAIEVPGQLDQAQVDFMHKLYDELYTGVWNMHRPPILPNGAKWVNAGMSLEDAQFVEGQKVSVQDVARIFQLPAVFLGAEVDARLTTEQLTLRLLQFSLHPRLTRIERGLANDPDLFPDSEPYPEFDTDGFIRTDARTRAEVQHFQIQDGTLLADEARAEMGRAALDEVNPDLPKGIGKTPQVVPVGGSPFGVPVPATNGSKGD
jgi:HK97 family phage portal protein